MIHPNHNDFHYPRQAPPFRTTILHDPSIREIEPDRSWPRAIVSGVALVLAFWSWVYLIWRYVL